jgi:hypothetical protein
VSGKELDRQFRVLGQTLSMHTILRDRYGKRALFLDVVLLACAVIFCATTFARDDLFMQVGLSPEKVRYVLGAASVAAFFGSLVSLRIDWKGKSARHQDAVQRMNTVSALFRKFREDNGNWPHDREAELQQAYWETMNNVINIPDNLFNDLKARYLRKVQISKMMDSAPGCPVLVLRFILMLRSVRTVSRRHDS